MENPPIIDIDGKILFISLYAIEKEPTQNTR